MEVATYIHNMYATYIIGRETIDPLGGGTVFKVMTAFSEVREVI